MSRSAQPVDYVLFYAKLRSFQEDGSCTLKHTCRRIFDQMATERGLAIDKFSMELPAADSAAEPNGVPGRKSRRHSKAQYRTFYWAFRASEEALMTEAEYVKLRLPLKDHAGNPLALCDEVSEREDCRCSLGCRPLEAPDDDCGQDHPLNDNRLDFITAPFVCSKRHLFFGEPASQAAEKPEAGIDTAEEKRAATRDSIPLTEAQRIYLTHSMLHRLDIHSELRRVLGPHPGAELCSVDCIYCKRLKRRIIENRPIVLEHLLDAKIFADEFALHDESLPEGWRASGGRRCGVCCLCGRCGRRDEASISPEETESSQQELPELTLAAELGPLPAVQPRTRDLRRRLHQTWRCCCRFQPLHLIRLYFGERLTFHYAWLGHLICSLFSLAAVGLAFLVYGLVNASLNFTTESEKLMVKLRNSSSVGTDGNAFTIQLIQLMQFIRLMFENHLTIPFGGVLTAWSLISTRHWRQFEAGLSHRWGVHECGLVEKRRPGFAPRRKVFYPACCQKRNDCHRCFGVFSFVLLCVSVVVAVAVALKVAELVASRRHCGGSGRQAECIFLSVILPITTHLLLMALLDWAYSRLAKKITDWENHDFASDYDASYAMKAFVLRCANNYASLFYIAFVRQEHAAFGELNDRCTVNKLDVDCFSLLNVYTAGYIIGRSLVKIVTDILKPCLQSPSLTRCLSAPARRLLCTACASFRRTVYAAELREIAAMERQLAQEAPASPRSSRGKSQTAEVMQLLRERSLAKEKSRDMLLDEHLEKTILHGYLVLFGSACYVTPLAVLLALLIDLRLDAKAQLHWRRRPVPLPAPGLAVWSRLHGLLNFAGIHSTAAVLAFTNNSLEVHGAQASVTNRLILFIVFTGLMHLLKYLISACSKGQANTLEMRRKWEYFHVPMILDKGQVAVDALEGLHDLQNSGRWYHVLLPCLTGATRLRPEAGPHQA